MRAPRVDHSAIAASMSESICTARAVSISRQENQVVRRGRGHGISTAARVRVRLNRRPRAAVDIPAQRRTVKRGSSNPRGEGFWGRRAPNLRIRRFYVAANSRSRLGKAGGSVERVEARDPLELDGLIGDPAPQRRVVDTVAPYLHSR
jgi:hypothetical protein